MIAVVSQISHDVDAFVHRAVVDCLSHNSDIFLQQTLIHSMWLRKKGNQRLIEKTFRETPSKLAEDSRQPISPEIAPRHDATFDESVPLGGSDYNATIDESANEVGGVTSEVRENVEVLRFHGKPPIARLTAFDDGSLSDGEVWRIRSPQHVIGRLNGQTMLEHDDDISGQHAEIRRVEVDGEFIWKLVDLDSTNGTFVRKNKSMVKDGAEFIVGCQRLVVESGSLVADSLSMRIPVATIDSQVMQLGRDESECSIAFPDDVCMNGVHAKIGRDSRGRLIVSDNHSKNGLWVRISTVELKHGFQFLLGGQRFLFEVPDP